MDDSRVINVLVTGGNGQLAKCIKDSVKELDAKNNYIFVGKDELNVCFISDAKKFIEENSIDVVVNCAAYTKVDLAEENIKEACSINSQAPLVLGHCCNENGAYLIHISTDYVFDGTKEKPYLETDWTNPINEYGATKLMGERSLGELSENYMIIRTQWLYSEYGKNFYNTMVEKIIENGILEENVRVVNDQFGCPTYARDLSDFIVTIIENGKYKGFTDDNRIFHFSNKGRCSWYDFAHSIEKSLNLKNKKDIVVPCSSDEFKTKAKRPKNSVLSKEKTEKLFDYKIENWVEGLKKCNFNKKRN